MESCGKDSSSNLSDLLWADPVDDEEGKSSSLFKHNEVRGCSYFYG